MTASPPKATASGRTEYIAGLARGLEVIQSFDQNNPEMTLSEVAAKTGLAPATARRCLFTLEDLGFVRRHGRRFLLSPRILSLGAAYLNSMSLRDAVQPVLDDLREEFHDASSLTILDGMNVVYICHAPSNREARLRQSLGSMLPAHATSVGLVLLAALPPERQRDFLAQAPLPRFTAKTPVTAAELKALFKQVAAQGFVVVEDTLEYGTVALAVPVRDRDGNVIAAINSSSERTRVDAAAMTARLPRLQRAATDITAALARFPALVHSLAGR